MMRYQQKLQKQMIDYQNAYNTPAQQMARARAAGLNPNLAYGDSATVSSTSASPGAAPTAEDPLNYQSIGGALSMFSNVLATIAINQSKAALNNAQANQASEMSKKLGSDIDLNKANIEYALQRNQLFKDTYDYMVSTTKANSEQATAYAAIAKAKATPELIQSLQTALQAQNEQAVYQASITYAESVIYDYKKQYAAQVEKLNVEKLKKEIAKLASSAAKDYSDMAVNNAQIGVLGSQEALNYANVGLVGAQVDLTHANQRYVNAKTNTENFNRHYSTLPADRTIKQVTAKAIADHPGIYAAQNLYGTNPLQLLNAVNGAVVGAMLK
jgi:hypothetical protein